MTELLILGLGTWAVWEWILLLLPFRVPALLQPLAVLALAFALHSIPDPRALLCLAACALVALIHQIVHAPQQVAMSRRRTRGF